MKYKGLTKLLEEKTNCELCEIFFGEDSCDQCKNVTKEAARLAYEAAIKEVQDFRNCDGCMAQEQGYARGYKEAAKDHNAWYMEDRNGEPIRLGDKVKTSEGILTVTRISGDIEPMECLIIASDDNGGWQFKPWKIEKVKHDTEEIIIDDLADAFGDKGDSGYREEAKQFYDRIAAQIKADMVF